MAQAIRMPPLGQTSDELEILAWHKAEGDDVAPGELLLEVATDKATLGVEATTAGTLLRIVHGKGETVREGTVIAYVGAPGEEVDKG
jgi:pyruvate dehydrogenase E2 component (dihydrolipoyllysine-residue acetyltransferase)